VIRPSQDRRIYSAELERRTIDVGGAQRVYWTAPQPANPAPLLVVLHGMGLNGPQMAGWTGLAVRGPAAGFATSFPEAAGEVWDDGGQGRRDTLDDAEFITALIKHQVAAGIARQESVFLVGLSNGAFFAERLARHGDVAARGLVLVAGTARDAIRRDAPRPARPTAVLAFEGTGDPMVPYQGGRARGLLAWMARRRAHRLLAGRDGREVVGAEALAADWAAVNGCSAEPTIEAVPAEPGGVSVDRLSWTGAGRPPVVLYRIEGGGHGWPGGPQYLPAAFVGRIARRLDATGILLSFAADQLRSEPVRGSMD
jgi:polyhydroxybutyrate depolymerase